MDSTIGPIDRINMRVSQIQPRRERDRRGGSNRDNRNGGFQTGLLLFLIGIAMIGLSVRVAAQKPSVMAAQISTYDAGGLPAPVSLQGD